MASTITVKVLFFASLRDELGLKELQLDLKDGSDRQILLDELSTVLSEDQFALIASKDVSVALNQLIQKSDFTLQHQDEIAFMPPVTGG